MTVRILVIDDNPVDRRLMREAIERLAAEGRCAVTFDEAGDGGEGTTALGSHPDLVLCDMGMPALGRDGTPIPSGSDVMRRATAEGARVVAVSGSGLGGARPLAVTAFVAKGPSLLGGLRAEVYDMLGLAPRGLAHTG